MNQLCKVKKIKTIDMLNLHDRDLNIQSSEYKLALVEIATDLSREEIENLFFTDFIEILNEVTRVNFGDAQQKAEKKS